MDAFVLDHVRLSDLNRQLHGSDGVRLNREIPQSWAGITVPEVSTSDVWQTSAGTQTIRVVLREHQPKLVPPLSACYSAEATGSTETPTAGSEIERSCEMPPI
jgi:hypothetical protein